jgi:hypothetical protein
VTVSTSDLIGLRYHPHGPGLWLRPDFSALLTTEAALAEATQILEPAAQEDEHDQE